MKYRKNPRTNQQISLLGFGMMRLPVIDEDYSKIDEKQAVEMLRYAIDGGVNYVDTAYFYHGGNSEVVTGKALKDGYREKVFLATKLPFGEAKDPSDLPKYLDTQLKRLDVNYIDYYLAHSIEDDAYDKFKTLGVYDFMKKEKEAGTLGQIGFSYHGSTPEFFTELLDSYEWDFAQIQLNFMDENYQAGVRGLLAAGERGIPIIIMEPLRGGMIANRLPAAVSAIYDSFPEKRSAADWAFNWVADFPEVMTILSGMGTMEQIEENLKILSKYDPECITDAERAVYASVKSEYEKLIVYGCTACKYCMPCPAGINIPGIIELRNNTTMYDCLKESKGDYIEWVGKPRASVCTNCKQCEEACPQQLKVSEIMAECVNMYEK